MRSWLQFRFQRQMWGCVLSLAAAMLSSRAQTPGQLTQQIAPATEIELHALSRQAGVIFAGQVIAIRHNDAATGVVEIDFAVEDAVRGVNGGTYTLREWAGLWSAANQPFRVGERYLMLLHAPGSAGLSSPVGGSDGAIPIRGGGMVDLRWIAARVVRPVAYSAAPLPRPPSLGFNERANAMSGSLSQIDLPAPVEAAASSTGSAAYPAVLALLRSWERAGDSDADAAR